MKISVVTASYNAAATLSDTLKSVARQSHGDVEHLLIDGGSKDATSRIVEQHGQHLSLFVSEKDGGIYDAMNKGIRLATGDVVGFLNADDLLADDEVLSRIARCMEDPEIDAVYGDLVFVSQHDTSRVVRYWRPGKHRAGLCASGWMAPHPTFYVRRKLLLENSGFRLEYRLSSDFELMLRLFEIVKIRSVYLPTTLVRMRMGGATTGSLRNIVRGNLEAARACRQHGYSGGLGFIVAKITRRIPQFFARPRKA